MNHLRIALLGLATAIAAVSAPTTAFAAAAYDNCASTNAMRSSSPTTVPAAEPTMIGRGVGSSASRRSSRADSATSGAYDVPSPGMRAGSRATDNVGGVGASRVAT